MVSTKARKPRLRKNLNDAGGPTGAVANDKADEPARNGGSSGQGFLRNNENGLCGEKKGMLTLFLTRLESKLMFKKLLEKARTGACAAICNGPKWAKCNRERNELLV